jgi:hypothetical protein
MFRSRGRGVVLDVKPMVETYDNAIKRQELIEQMDEYEASIARIWADINAQKMRGEPLPRCDDRAAAILGYRRLLAYAMGLVDPHADD